MYTIQKFFSRPETHLKQEIIVYLNCSLRFAEMPEIISDFCCALNKECVRPELFHEKRTQSLCYIVFKATLERQQLFKIFFAKIHKKCKVTYRIS